MNTTAHNVTLLLVGLSVGVALSMFEKELREVGAWLALKLRDRREQAFPKPLLLFYGEDHDSGGGYYVGPVASIAEGQKRFRDWCIGSSRAAHCWGQVVSRATLEVVESLSWSAPTPSHGLEPGGVYYVSREWDGTLRYEFNATKLAEAATSADACELCKGHGTIEVGQGSAAEDWPCPRCYVRDPEAASARAKTFYSGTLGEAFDSSVFTTSAELDRLTAAEQWMRQAIGQVLGEQLHARETPSAAAEYSYAAEHCAGCGDLFAPHSTPESDPAGRKCRDCYSKRFPR